jgi:hypothetical protein
MKVIAAHSVQGVIDHFVVLPDQAPPAAVGVTGAQLLTVVDVTGVKLDAKKPETLEKLSETIRKFRVDVTGPGRLLKKEG